MYVADRAFIIIGPGRSGSTLLRMSLHGLPGIRCHGELFNPSRVLGFENFAESGVVSKAGEDYRETLLAIRKSDPVGFVRNYALCRTGVEAVGFKLLQRHCMQDYFPPVLRFLTEDTAIRVVFLWRENEFRRYVSERVLRHGGPATSLKPGRKQGPVTIRVDPNAFVLETEQQRELFHHLKKLFGAHPILEMTYEGLCRDFTHSLGLVADFVGVAKPTGTITPLLSKVGTRALSQVIENFEQIRRHPRILPYLD